MEEYNEDKHGIVYPEQDFWPSHVFIEENEVIGDVILEDFNRELMICYIDVKDDQNNYLSKAVEHLKNLDKKFEYITGESPIDKRKDWEKLGAKFIDGDDYAFVIPLNN